MNGPITYEMFSAVIAAIVTVGGAWFFIERRIKDVEVESRRAVDQVHREGSLQAKAALAEVSILRETVHTKYVSIDSLIRLEERILS